MFFGDGTFVLKKAGGDYVILFDKYFFDPQSLADFINVQQTDFVMTYSDSIFKIEDKTGTVQAIRATGNLRSMLGLHDEQELTQPLNKNIYHIEYLKLVSPDI